MKILSLFLLFIIFASCSSLVNRDEINKDEVMTKAQENIRPEKKTHFNLDIKPGFVTLMEIPLESELDHGVLTCGEKYIPYFYENGHIKAYLSESYFSNMKDYDCLFYKKNGEEEKKIFSVQVDVNPYDFPSEKLRVNSKRVFLSKKDAKRAKRERALLYKIYQSSSSKKLFTKPFYKPINSFITSIYGTKRVFNKKKKSQHLGTDFRAKVGTPIKVANNGKVVFAGNLFYTGNTVIVDHGIGIFTVYGHLSELLSRTGQMVEQYQTIGKAGKTGRVSGPHLHWGVKVHGNWVDGLSRCCRHLVKK